MPKTNRSTQENSYTIKSEVKLISMFARLIIILFLAFTILGGLYLMNNLPTYLILSIQPPPDQYGPREWLNNSYVTFLYIENTPFISPKYYILRRTTFVASDQDLQINPTWNSIISYFDRNLSNLGWIRNKIEIPCDVFLPEAKFMRGGENGFIEYIPKNQEKHVSQNPFSYNGNVVCLAVWSEDRIQGGVPAGFNIVFLTSKPSPITKFLDIFSE